MLLVCSQCAAIMLIMRSNKNKGEVAAVQPPIAPPRPNTHHTAPYSRHYFHFDIPDSQRSYIHIAPNSTPTASQPKTITLRLADTRKELIKQKIKFRVKQEIYTLLKRKVEAEKADGQEVKEFREEDASHIDLVGKRTARSQSFVYIKGKSSTQFRRESFNQRKHSQTDVSKSNIRNFSEAFLDSEPRNIRKRVWSSAVKMRDKDRLQLEKQCKISASVVKHDKLDSYKIEPWRQSEDPEMHME